MPLSRETFFEPSFPSTMILFWKERPQCLLYMPYSQAAGTRRNTQTRGKLNTLGNILVVSGIHVYHQCPITQLNVAELAYFT